MKRRQTAIRREAKEAAKSDTVLNNIKLLEEAGVKNMRVHYNSTMKQWEAAIESDRYGGIDIKLEKECLQVFFHKNGMSVSPHTGRNARMKWFNISVEKFISQYIKNIWIEDKKNIVSAEENYRWCHRKNEFFNEEDIQNNLKIHIIPTGKYNKIDSNRDPHGWLNSDSDPHGWLNHVMTGYGIDIEEERVVLPVALYVHYGNLDEDNPIDTGTTKGIVNFKVVTFAPDAVKSESSESEYYYKWFPYETTQWYTGKFTNMVKRHIHNEVGLEDSIYMGHVHKLTHYNAIKMFIKGPDAYYKAIKNTIDEKEACYAEQKRQTAIRREAKEAAKRAKRCIRRIKKHL